MRLAYKLQSGEVQQLPASQLSARPALQSSQQARHVDELWNLLACFEHFWARREYSQASNSQILRGQARLIYSSKWRGATVAWFADLCRACGAEQPAGQTRRRTRDSVLLICMLYCTYIQNVAANSPRTVSGTYSHAHVCAHCKSASYGHSSNMSCLRAAGLFAFLGIRYRN